MATCTHNTNVEYGTPEYVTVSEPAHLAGQVFVAVSRWESCDECGDSQSSVAVSSLERWNAQMNAEFYLLDDGTVEDENGHGHTLYAADGSPLRLVYAVRPLQYLADYTAAPPFSAFRFPDRDLSEIADEINASNDLNADTDRAAVAAAIAAEQAGATVLSAHDADGWYFAVRGPDVYADAAVLAPCDCDDLYRVMAHTHADDFQCPGCGFTVIVEGEINAAGEGVEFVAGEWRVRCPGCGIVYVLTE